jgi:membrane dipeptidase
MNSLRYLLFIGLCMLMACASETDSSGSDDEALRARADELAQQFLILDGHIDIPYRLDEMMEDISVTTEGGDFDYPRAIKGGLNAPFMSIYIPASYQETGGAKAYANSLIDMVEGFEKKWPGKFAVATSVADVKKQFEQKGLISLPMGMENGAPVEGDLANLKHFYDRGIRYITLTHGTDNHICDSSYDTTGTWGGLSPFGHEVVHEMNRLGIMIDVSHISDDTFWQVMDMTDVPVIASHSSARYFTPGFERNMSDDMIKRLGDNGGVIQINFGSSFISGEIRKKSDGLYAALGAFMAENNVGEDSPETLAFLEEYRKEHEIGYADVTEVVDHIDHVVNLVGVNHVGLGSDFDGVGDSLPTGLKDVSYYPNLIYHLLKRGYSEADIEKICSGNVLRVWSAVEQAAEAS